MRGKLVEAAKKEHTKITEAVHQLNGIVGFLEEIISWSRENSSEEVLNSSYMVDYMGAMYDPTVEPKVLLESISRLEVWFERISFEAIRNVDLEIIIDSMKRVNALYVQEVEKARELVNAYAGIVEFPSLLA